MSKLIIGFLTILLISCSINDAIEINIENSQEELTTLPRYYPEKISFRQVDLRNKDISKIKLVGREYDLHHSVFDNYTLWPDILPSSFNPESLINNNLDPGLNLKQLHKNGIDGSGVKIAIIDLPISFIHSDLIKEKITIYESKYNSIRSLDDYFHGHAILSILVGQKTGVAPNAEIIYIEATGFNDNDVYSCSYEIKALDSVLQYNQKNENKIDIVSISSGANKDRPFYDEYLGKIKELEAAGIPVISPSLQIYSDKYHFYGLKRKPYDNPNKISVYETIDWNNWLNKISFNLGQMEEYINSFKSGIYRRKTLLLPLDPKSYHGYLNQNHYIYSFIGGWSWLPPYISGLYALCKQVNNNITFDQFWNIAYETGDKHEFQANGEIIYGSIVNPRRMIERIKNDV